MMVNELGRHLDPLKQAEASVLVDVLHTPERLFARGSRLRLKCEGGGVVAKLIQHCKLLQKDQQEYLCVRVLQTLCKMAKARRNDFGLQVSLSEHQHSTKLTQHILRVREPQSWVVTPKLHSG